MSDNATAVREWIVEQTTLILDNDQRAYVLVTAAAQDALVDAGTRHDYENALRVRGDAIRKYEDLVGEAVVEAIGTLIGQRDKSLAETILREIMDLSDSVQTAMFGAHYLPERGDLDDIPWSEE